jgi:hypothetical protein
MTTIWKPVLAAVSPSPVFEAIAEVACNRTAGRQNSRRAGYSYRADSLASGVENAYLNA